MNVVRVIVFARRADLGSVVKAQFDRHRLGLTEIVRVHDVSTVKVTVRRLTPSVLLLVGTSFDAVSLGVCRYLEQHPVSNQQPLVVALEEASEVDRVAALEAGADCVVHPFDLLAIERRVRWAARPMNEDATFDGGELPVESELSTVMVAGRQVTLTPIEANVLRLLIRRRQRIVTRAELEQQIWGITNSRTLDVHVLRLRRKLGSLRRRIETVRKWGYRYNECA